MKSHPSQAVSCFSDTETRAVLDQLQIVIASQHFRNSKRCSALLELAVRNTLTGHVEKLRERQLGMTLFGRELGYDTNADPIVRVTAGEVRKRLAQYYQEERGSVPIRIELPPGSYVAELHIETLVQEFLSQPVQLPPAAVFPESTFATGLMPTEGVAAAMPGPASQSSKLPNRKRQWIAAALAVSIVCTLLAAFVIKNHNQWETRFWSDFLTGSESVPLMIGQLHDVDPSPSKPDTLTSDIHRGTRLTPLGDASAAITLCNTIASLKRRCVLFPSRTTELPAIQNRTAVYLGAYNNPWVSRLTDPLRFGLEPAPARAIIDHKTGAVLGSVDFNQPRESIAVDYALIGRFHSDVTDSFVVVVAGIGPMSTEGAAEFVTSPARMRELHAAAPPGWSGTNVEAVLATDIVNGKPGHSRIIASNFW